MLSESANVQDRLAKRSPGHTIQPQRPKTKMENEHKTETKQIKKQRRFG